MRVLALGVLLAAMPFIAEGQLVEESIDRFTGERSLTYSNSEPIRVGKPKVMLSSLKPNPEMDAVARVSFITSNLSNRSGSSWKYLRCQRVDWLVDGQPYPLGLVVHDGRVARGGVVEILHQAVTLDQLRAIGQSERVEYRLCTDEFQLSPEDIKAFREFGELLSTR